MKTLTILLLSLATYGCAINVNAQNKEVVEAPKFVVGDKWEYLTLKKTTFSYEVVEVADVVALKNKNGKRIVVTLEWNFTTGQSKKGDGPIRFFPSIPRLNFPLWVGKKWTVPFFSVGGRQKVKFWMIGRATAWEDVKVPAGTFRALKIENEMSGSEGFTTVNEVCWYAPEVKSIIRCERPPGEISSELVDFKVQ